MDIMFLLFTALLVFASASWAWGVDSRDGSSDRRRLIYPAVTRG